MGRLECNGGKAIGLKDIHGPLVEPEPQHVGWASKSVRLNGLDRDIEVIAVAISNALHHRCASAEMRRCVMVPAGRRTWHPPTQESHFGHKVYRDRWYGYVYVPTIAFEKAAESLDHIDLIDTDRQGACCLGWNC